MHELGQAALTILPNINAETPTEAIGKMRDFLASAPPGERMALTVHLTEALSEILRLRARTGEGFAGAAGYKRITLCGSARFRPAFDYWHRRLMLDENAMVFTAPQLAGGGELTRGEKATIDLVWFAQIETSDEVFVLDLDGYVGRSTTEEIAFARERGIKVRRLSDEFPEWRLEES